jgi:hypothetical protein
MSGIIGMPFHSLESTERMPGRERSDLFIVIALSLVGDCKC